MNNLYCSKQFEIIEQAKKDILEGTNIDTSPDEMKVLDNFLLRCWQMGWLDKYVYKRTKEEIIEMLGKEKQRLEKLSGEVFFVACGLNDAIEDLEEL